MFGNILGLIIFICLAGAAYYFLVVKPHQDKKKVTVPVAPLSLVWKEETAKNSAQANGNRSHFRFIHPGSFYGKNIEIQFDDIAPVWVVTDGSVRTMAGSRLWKPISDNTKKLAILGDSNKVYQKCTIRYQW